MALFFLVALGGSAPTFQVAISAKVDQKNVYTIEDGKWIVESTLTTSKEVSDSLGVPNTEMFFIVPVTGYFGRAQPDLWEWLAAKIAAKAAAKA